MANSDRWWNSFASERYWLEVTDRLDIGVNLKAPVSNEKGRGFWGYSFIKEIRPGDIVFHYDKNEGAIIGSSIATGITWTDVITWAAHGTSARAAGIRPHSREGTYLGLERYSRLEKILTLADIRSASVHIDSHFATLKQVISGPLYYPFERGAKRKTRPMQGYLFKLPAFFVEVFPHLSNSIPIVSAKEVLSRLPGTSYRRPPEDIAVAERDPFGVDPSIVERGVRGHVCTQNLLADALLNLRIVPRSPVSIEPSFDLAWVIDSKMWVAEVKSLTENNEENQLRLGLGQVLRYAHLLRRLYLLKVFPVLAVERQPANDDWIELCDQHKVILLWPPFEGKLRRLKIVPKDVPS